jgi:hypothetical protein
LARDCAHALPQRDRLWECVVTIVFNNREFAHRRRLLGYDRFMLREHRLAPDATISGIIVFALQRTSDRPAHPMPLR